MYELCGYSLVGLLLVTRADGSESCPQGFWDSDCKTPCPANCDEEESTKHVYCDKDTGNCAEGCKAGFYKQHCDVQCKDCPSGRCVQVDGTCLPGAASGVLHPNSFLIMLSMLIPVNRNIIGVITVTLAYQGGPSRWNLITSVGLLCLSTFTVLALTTT